MPIVIHKMKEISDLLVGEFPVVKLGLGRYGKRAAYSNVVLESLGVVQSQRSRHSWRLDALRGLLR